MADADLELILQRGSKATFKGVPTGAQTGELSVNFLFPEGVFQVKSLTVIENSDNNSIDKVGTVSVMAAGSTSVVYRVITSMDFNYKGQQSSTYFMSRYTANDLILYPGDHLYYQNVDLSTGSGVYMNAFVEVEIIR